MKILFLALFDEWCLGLRQLSATLKREGHHVSLAVLKSLPEMHGCEGENAPEGFHVPPASVSGADFAALTSLVSRLQPDLIGLGFTSNFSGLAQHVTALFRKITKAPIAWGGIDPTANPDISIEHADIVCVGEGDEAILELTQRMMAGEPITDIANLWVRQDGQIFKNAIRPLLTDLDSLPFADFDPQDKYWISDGKAREGELHPDSHLLRSFPIMTTRGCPYACTFCCNSMLRDMYGNKNYVRTRAVKNVIQELREHLERNPQTQWIEIWDDVFGVDMKWAEEFAGAYAAEIGIPFWCYTYPAFIKPRLVAALKRAGIGFLVMGIQSGSQRILSDIYRRRVPNQKVLDAVKMITDGGITLLVDLIDGYPFQTEQDNLDTMELMLQMPDGVIMQQINQLSFYRNYPLIDIAQAQGYSVEMIPGRNTAVPPDTPESEFWRGILTLTQFKSIAADEIRAMAMDPYLREHPKMVTTMANAMINATYLPNTRVLRSEQVRQMGEEINELRQELETLRSSRLIKYALSLRSVLGRGESGKSGNRLRKWKYDPTQKERTARAISTATDRKRQSVS